MADFSCNIKTFTLEGTEITPSYVGNGFTVVKAIFTQLSGTPVLGENKAHIRLDVVDSQNQASIIEIDSSLIIESIDGSDVVFESTINGELLTSLPKISARIYQATEPTLGEYASSDYSSDYLI